MESTATKTKIRRRRRINKNRKNAYICMGIFAFFVLLLIAIIVLTLTNVIENSTLPAPVFWDLFSSSLQLLHYSLWEDITMTRSDISWEIFFQ